MSLKIFESLVPSMACNTIIEEGKSRPQLDAGIGQTNTKSVGRSTQVTFIHNEFTKSFIYELVRTHYKNYVIEEAEDLQFATYNKGDFYGPHFDADETNGRILSVSVQLSKPSESEGGDLCVYGIGGAPTPLTNAQGSVIIFPSDMLHEVEPVTKGTRYSLVQWFKGYESSN